MSKKVESCRKITPLNKEVKIQIPLEKYVDNEYPKTVTLPGKIEVIERNVPSSQVLKNFSLKIIQIKQRLAEGG